VLARLLPASTEPSQHLTKCLDLPAHATPQSLQAVQHAIHPGNQEPVACRWAAKLLFTVLQCCCYLLLVLSIVRAYAITAAHLITTMFDMFLHTITCMLQAAYKAVPSLTIP
jgi:hypothetical protein